MKSKLLEKVWLTLAALGIGVSLFANNSNQLIESNAQTFSSAIGQLPQTEVQGLVARQLTLTRTPTCLDTDLTYQQQSFGYCRQRSSIYQSLLSP